MESIEIHETNKPDENSIHENQDKKNKLNIEQFELNDEKNRKSQKLFHYALGLLISEYNENGKEKSEKKGIYLLKEENNKNILLANLTEELVNGYYNYETLFNGLMKGDDQFYYQYDQQFDKKSHQSYQDNISNSGSNAARSHHSFQTSNKKEENKIKNDKRKKVMDNFANFFNGIFFESVASDVLFKIIDAENDVKDDSNKVVSFLPRISFYMKDIKDKESNKFHGYNEIDCAFILKGKDEVIIDKKMISCFKKFKTRIESNFYNDSNLRNISIKKNDVVIMEIKSSWISLTNTNDKRENQLRIFIKKAKRFIGYYKKLNLIKSDQKVLLIYLFDNSMHYDIHTDNKEIEKVYNNLNEDKNIELCIAYFQPYLKIMGSYDRVHKLKTLNNKVNDLAVKQKIQEELNTQQKLEIEKLNDQINELKETVRLFMNEKKNPEGNNKEANEHMDNKKKSF